MKRILMTALLAALGVPAAIHAQPAATPAADRTPGKGAQTREWIELQKSGQAAPREAEAPMPGEVADRVYQRYVESFAHPIPETYPRDAFSSGGQSK